MHSNFQRSLPQMTYILDLQPSFRHVYLKVCVFSLYVIVERHSSRHCHHHDLGADFGDFWMGNYGTIIEKYGIING